MIISDGQRLVSAHYTSGYEIPIYDDGYGPVWIFRCSIATLGIVRARSWKDAYSICEDEFFSEADESLEDLIKEYGFKRENVKIVLGPDGEREATSEDYPNGKLAVPFVRWETRETPDPEAWMENELFQESYGFRPNGANVQDKHGHGIYQRDLNGESLDQLTPELLARLEITLEIKEEE